MQRRSNNGLRSQRRKSTLEKKEEILEDLAEADLKPKKCEKRPEKIIIDDRCEHFNNSVRCPARKTTKTFCDRHENSRKTPKPVILQKHDCPICLEQQENMKWFSCSHGLCMECFGQVRQFICPVCRADIRFDLTTPEYNKINNNVRLADNSNNLFQQQQSARLAQQLQYQDDDDESEEEYNNEISRFASGILGSVTRPPLRPTAPPPAPRRTITDILNMVVGLASRPSSIMPNTPAPTNQTTNQLSTPTNNAMMYNRWRRQ